eukprot:COSAG05_NODE_5070_length_1272_cov_8.383662_1_plen_35_part_10
MLIKISQMFELSKEHDSFGTKSRPEQCQAQSEEAD